MTNEKADIVYHLSLINIYCIIGYYSILFLLSCICIAYTIYLEYMQLVKLPVIVLAVGGSCGSSLAGSVIYYIRKIYMLCIKGKIYKADDRGKVEQFGTMVYFMIRPLFALVVCAIIILGFSAGIFAFFVNGGILKNAFIEFSMVVSFFLGISNGTLMDQLGRIGKSYIKKILD